MDYVLSKTLVRAEKILSKPCFKLWRIPVSMLPPALVHCEEDIQVS